MSYLEQLKSETPYQGAPPKHPKGAYGGFGSEGERHFSENQAPAVAVDLDTPAGPRSITVTGNSGQKMAATLPPLPEGCPLLGGPVPAGCRFHPKLFARLKAEGALPTPDGGCPLRAVCKLGRSD